MSRHLRDLLKLLDSATYEDSYGVYRSEFTVCRICESESGAGVLRRQNWHKAGCPVPRMQAKYQERGPRSKTPNLYACSCFANYLRGCLKTVNCYRLRNAPLAP